MRILRLHEALERMGVRRNGTILEIGSLFGSFALILPASWISSHTGSYGSGFSAAVNLMKQAGVQVVSTTRG